MVNFLVSRQRQNPCTPAHGSPKNHSNTPLCPSRLRGEYRYFGPHQPKTPPLAGPSSPAPTGDPHRKHSHPVTANPATKPRPGDGQTPKVAVTRTHPAPPGAGSQKPIIPEPEASHPASARCRKQISNHDKWTRTAFRAPFDLPRLHP